MTHLLLAKIWRLLALRNAFDSLLWEIIGRYASNVAGKDLATTKASAAEVVVWIKAFVDYQRVLTQRAHVNHNISFISPDKLLTTINFLLDLQNSLFDNSDSSEDASRSCFIAAAALSTLRAIVLSNALSRDSLAASEFEDLDVKITQWQGSTQSRLEKAILVCCQTQVAQLVNDTNASLGSGDLRHLEVFSEDGKYPFKDPVQQPFEYASSNVFSLGDQHFWVMFDFLGGVEAAFLYGCIQSHIEDTDIVTDLGTDAFRRRGEVQGQDHYTERTSIDTEREDIFGIFNTLSNGNRDTHHSLTHSVLNAVILHWCVGACRYYEVATPRQQRQGQEISNNSGDMAFPVNVELNTFWEFLEDRETKLLQQERLIQDVESRLLHAISDWRNDSVELSRNTEYRRRPATTYFINCRRLHKLSYADLWAIVRGNSDLRKKLEEGNDLHNLSGIECTKDHDDDQSTRRIFTSAIRIAPFDIVHQDIHSSRRYQKVSTRNEPVSPTATPSLVALPPAQVRQQSSGANVVREEGGDTTTNHGERSGSSTTSGGSSNPEPVVTPGREGRSLIHRIRGRGHRGNTESNRETQNPPETTTLTPAGVPVELLSNFRYSADGRSLLVWNLQRRRFCYGSLPIDVSDDSKTIILKCYKSPQVNRVCAGNKCVAVLEARENRESPLKIFVLNTETAKAGYATLPISAGTADITMSSDDRYLAIATGKFVCRVRINESTQSNEITLEEMPALNTSTPPSQNTGDQMVRFSHGNKFLCSAAIMNDGTTTVDAFNLEGYPRFCSVTKIVRSGDNRYLSSVHYIPRHKLALVTAWNNKPYDRVLSNARSAQVSLHWDVVGYRIQAAALAPNAERAIMVDDRGRIWSKDLQAGIEIASRPNEVYRTSRGLIRDADKPMAVAITDSGFISFCWIEKSGMTLSILDPDARKTEPPEPYQVLLEPDNNTS